MSTLYEESLLKFDDLYYSFSSNLEGVKQFATKDKNVRYDLFLIIAKPIEAIDFNLLGNDLFENFNMSRYYAENEIVSKLNLNAIDSVYYLKNAENIDDYQHHSILIRKEDVSLNIKEIIQRYNLPIF